MVKSYKELVAWQKGMELVRREMCESSAGCMVCSGKVKVKIRSF